jgi:hypothetical protein
MTIILSSILFVVCATSMLVTAFSLRHAPVATEDDNGFHPEPRA